MTTKRTQPTPAENLMTARAGLRAVAVFLAEVAFDLAATTRAEGATTKRRRRRNRKVRHNV
ncbi:hypothetical protein [Roseomonas sp. AR75]|uniref:hypothetical protein n=1 Tax=Roseomonas sp. AR75 TaxID=2562311 RepID=UPI0010C0F2F3|nr:hypothetical protein [Roseomonas sp. AR75]